MGRVQVCRLWLAGCWSLSSALGVLVTAGGRGGETEAGSWSIQAALMKEEGIFRGSGVSGPPKCELALWVPRSASTFSLFFFSFLKNPEWCLRRVTLGQEPRTYSLGFSFSLAG